MSDEQLMAMISDERRRAADLIESLTPEQLATPSLCGEWTVKQVAAHLIAPFATKRRWFLGVSIRSRFRLHRAIAMLAERIAERPAGEIAAVLRENADRPYKAPIVGFFGQLTDLQIHGQDIRRPLGLPRELHPDRLRVSLDFLVSRRAGGAFVPRGRTAGLRFEATDLEWASGTGKTVRGPAEAVMLALTGRAVVLPELAGEGLPDLRARLATVDSAR
ncbi:maleylpyruvate isomerase family mycothiol-dependent enzyme [Actinoplanes sp. NPDC049548]|uniref:maleylpyruvate isomerase family mycothiol-dependent enzyme n=1 Tax=Actinoplanes sp. NPDC049548 TaxID=3155152 RepID=UPI00343A3608